MTMFLQCKRKLIFDIKPDLDFIFFFQNTTWKSQKSSQDTKWRRSALQLQTVRGIRSSAVHSRSKSLSNVSATLAWYWPLWVAERWGAARQLAALLWGLVSLSPTPRGATGAEWLCHLLWRLTNGTLCIYSIKIIFYFCTIFLLLCMSVCQKSHCT